MSGTVRNGRNAMFMFATDVPGTGQAVPILAKNKWTVDNSANPFDTTAFGDSNKSAGQDLPDAKMTIAGFWDASDQGWKKVIGSSIGRKGYLYPDFINNPTDYFFGTFYASITSDGAQTGPVNQTWTITAAAFAGWN